MSPATARVVIVGAGPRASGLIERFGANAPELFPHPLEVHLVDPFPEGAGRVWRHGQSPLLRMNSMAEDVTVFTDDSVVLEGPVRPGPSLAEWARDVPPDVLPDLPPDVRAELAATGPTSFPGRRVQGAYLRWFHGLAEASLPAGSSVRVHRTSAVRLTGSPGEPQRVWLADRAEPLVADVVVLALGHLDAEPSAGEAELASYAGRHGLLYLPPDYTADTDLSAVPAGADVVVRGLGLAFVDLFVLLAEERGGRFTREGGVLRYVPSGREPRLHAGSRRGLPYHSKTGYRLRGAPPEPPRFFSADALAAASSGDLDFRRDVWPLMAKDVAYGYYRELFTGHPGRVRKPWDEFAGCFAELDWYDPEMRELEEAVAEEDRIDFERLDRPLDGLVFASPDEFQAHVRGYVEADLARRSDDRWSADLGAFLALLGVYGQYARLAATGRVRGDGGWWHGFFSWFASGPPPDRLEQLLALSRAGVVRFLGADAWVRAEDGAFLAGGASVPGHVVRASGLIEARLPVHELGRTANPLLRSLRDAGEVLADEAGQVRVAAGDSRLLDARGEPHARRFAVGPYTSNRAYAAFARPNTNAPAFRQNDEVAREVLRFLTSG